MTVEIMIVSDTKATPIKKSSEDIKADYNKFTAYIKNNATVAKNASNDNKLPPIDIYLAKQVNDQYLMLAQSRVGIKRPSVANDNGRPIAPTLWYKRLPNGTYMFMAYYYNRPIATVGYIVNNLKSVKAVLDLFVNVAKNSDVVMQEIFAARPSNTNYTPRYSMYRLLSLNFA